MEHSPSKNPGILLTGQAGSMTTAHEPTCLPVNPFCSNFSRKSLTDILDRLTRTVKGGCLF